MRKYVKAHKKIAFYLIDMEIFNAHVLHFRIKSAIEAGIVSHRSVISEELLEQVSLSNYNCCKCPSTSDTTLRLQERNGTLLS